MDLLFIVDIIVNFNSAFYTINDVLVTDRRRITKRYIKGWFLVDFLACIPFQLIETDDSNSD